MASIHEESPKHWRVTFTLDGWYKNIRLGKCTKNDAKTALIYVERLISSKRLASAPDGETIAWLNRLDQKIYDRIVKAGLAMPRQTQKVPTLKELIDKFKGTFIGKPQTAVAYGHTTRNLLAYFTDCPLNQITEQRADEFRVWLDKAQNLSRATVARRIIAARTIWKNGQRWKMTIENPFTGVKAGNQANEARKRFVPAEDVFKLMDACPDALLRLVIALGRFGGVRVPSEILLLKWEDVNWEKRLIHITSPKTEHHTGGGSRIIPLFPELEGPLKDCLNQTQDGEVFIFQQYQGKSLNLRTQFNRIAQRAGLNVWPKPFHNMRASRQTELTEMPNIGPHRACQIMGNSLRVAEPHYLMPTPPEELVRLALSIKTSGINSGITLAQIPSLQPPVPPSTKTQSGDKTVDKQQLLPQHADKYRYVHKKSLGAAGFEPA